jgi:NAD-dependent DNA ligase
MQVVQLESLPGFGHKRVNNIFSAIEASKTAPASVLLLALGISGIGSVTAEVLLQHCGHSILVCPTCSYITCMHGMNTA